MTTLTEYEQNFIKSAKEFLRVNQRHGHSDTACIYIAGFLDLLDRLTAVSQVGEQDLLQKCLTNIDLLQKCLTNIKATGKALETATIEHCKEAVKATLSVRPSAIQMKISSDFNEGVVHGLEWASKQIAAAFDQLDTAGKP